MAGFNINAKVSGGEKLAPYLRRLAHEAGKGAIVRVGFLEGAKYPDSDNTRFLKGVHKLASEKGGGHTVLKLPAVPKVVKGLPVAQVAFWNNFGTNTSGPRPFFSQTIAVQSKTWGRKLAAVAKKNMENGGKADPKRWMALLGTDIKDQLKRSIRKWPADNAPLTVAIKGFNHGLVDSSVMERAVDFEVKDAP